MINPKKRRRNEFEASAEFQQRNPSQRILSHSKETRAHSDIEKSLLFLDSGDAKDLVKKVRKNARERPSYPVIIKRRELSLDEQRRVRWLRFHSLDSADVQWHRSIDVFKMTGVLPCTQRKLIKRWLANNMQVLSFKGLRGKQRMLSEAQRHYIASPQMLLEMRHLSLAQRAEVIRERLNLPSLSAMSVSKIYRECGARYQKPQVIYRSKGERQFELLHQQKQFSQEITRTLMLEPEVDIVYIDETTFNLW
jgi:transposase